LGNDDVLSSAYNYYDGRAFFSVAGRAIKKRADSPRNSERAVKTLSELCLAVATLCSDRTEHIVTAIVIVL